MKKKMKKLMAMIGAFIMMLVLSQNLAVVKASTLPDVDVTMPGTAISYTEAEVKDSEEIFTATGDVATYALPVFSWNTESIEMESVTGYLYKIDPAQGELFNMKLEYAGTDNDFNLYGEIYYPMDAGNGEYCLTESYISLDVSNNAEVFAVSEEAYLFLPEGDWSDVSITISKMKNIVTLKDTAITVTKESAISETISDFYYTYNSDNFFNRGFLVKLPIKPYEGYTVNLEDNDNGNAQLLIFEEANLGKEASFYEGSVEKNLVNSSDKEIIYYIWVSSINGSLDSLTLNVSDIEMVSDRDNTKLTIDAKPVGVVAKEEHINVISQQFDENGNPYNAFTIYSGQAYCVEVPANSINKLKVEFVGEQKSENASQYATTYIVDENDFVTSSLWVSDFKEAAYEENVDVYLLENTGNKTKKYYFIVSGEYDEGNIQISVESIPEVKVSYRTHIQSIGWEAAENDISKWKSDGAMSGTSGKAKRLEGINIVVNSADVAKDLDLGIQYTTHCQSYGWLPWSSNGEMNGTEGEAKRLEAISIKLTGKDAICYDIYYRVHAQSYGWLNWAKNGAVAGTAGYGKRLEGIQIVVVKKGTAINEKLGGIQSVKTEAYIAKDGVSPVVNYGGIPNSTQDIPGDQIINVAYRTHVQSYGWQGWKYNGQMSGTSGKSKRLEGINIKLTNQKFDGDIVYTTHVQKYGWQGKLDDQSTWKKNGQMAGTSGEAKRLEAICINLTGDMAEYYDIYYRVHAQSYGWLGWVKNGNPAGTAGYGKRLEGIQIVLVTKGEAGPDDYYEGISSTRTEGYISK